MLRNSADLSEKEKEKEKAETSEPAECNLESLPIEMISHVLSFTSTADRARAGRANRLFATAAQDSLLPRKAEKFYAVGLPIPRMEYSSLRLLCEIRTSIPDAEIKNSFANEQELRFFKTELEAQSYIYMIMNSSNARFTKYPGLKKLNCTPGIMEAMVSPTFLQAHNEEISLNRLPDMVGDKELDCAGVIPDERLCSVSMLLATCPRKEIYPVSCKLAKFPAMTRAQIADEREKANFCLTM